MKYQPTIGLEVHVELETKSKMFCTCPADHFSKAANSQVCPVCLGLPGALPYVNKKAIDWTIMLGMALGCKISKESKFDRKHYFYPDLPKGYQISQYDLPLCQGGKLKLTSGKTIKIRRIHIEEDTGKLVHTKVDGKSVSLVDFNRSGVPLVEIVTEPDITSSSEAQDFAKKIQLLVRYLGISSADMEKGSMRLEANISLSSQDKLAGYKVELKNINSFRFMGKAIEAEITRQSEALNGGIKLIQETRGYDEAKGKTFSQRTKEEEQDYRYFPEPDIPPFNFSEDVLNEIKKNIPKLPGEYESEFGRLNLPENYIEVLVSDPSRASYFSETAIIGKKHGIDAKELAGVIVNQNMDKDFPLASSLIEKLVKVTKKKYATTAEVGDAVQEVLAKNEKAVADYKMGKKEVLGFLIGQVQSKLGGTGEIMEIQKTLLKHLSD